MLIFRGCKTLGINLATLSDSMTWLCDHLRSLEKGISWPEFLGVSGGYTTPLTCSVSKALKSGSRSFTNHDFMEWHFSVGFLLRSLLPCQPKYPIITNWMVCPLCVWKMSCLFVNTLQQTNIAAEKISNFPIRDTYKKHVWFSMTCIY